LQHGTHNLKSFRFKLWAVQPRRETRLQAKLYLELQGYCGNSLVQIKLSVGSVPHVSVGPKRKRTTRNRRLLPY
jgi:hypothetical protein